MTAVTIVRGRFLTFMRTSNREDDRARDLVSSSSLANGKKGHVVRDLFGVDTLLGSDRARVATQAET